MKNYLTNRFATLLVKAISSELSDGENIELDSLIAELPEVQQRAYMRLKENGKQDLLKHFQRPWEKERFWRGLNQIPDNPRQWYRCKISQQKSKHLIAALRKMAKK